MTHVDSEIMDAYTLIFDGLKYLGPGDTETTRACIENVCADLPAEPRIADFGCGVGASTLVLAENIPKAHLLALDIHPPFISRLQAEAAKRWLGEGVSAVVGDMADPPLLDGVAGEFDLIWSESAIYNIGRMNAFKCWHSLLKPGGWLVFSDIVWQSDRIDQGSVASTFWKTEYPDITTVDAVLGELVSTGYEPLKPVKCKQQAWSNYYEPLRERLAILEKKRDRSQALIDVMSELKNEIDIYEQGFEDVAVVFFFARKVDVPGGQGV